MQSAFQEKFSCTMAVWGLLDDRSVMVSRMRAFAVASEMGRGGVSMAVAAVFAIYPSNYALGPILRASLHSLNTFYPLITSILNVATRCILFT